MPTTTPSASRRTRRRSEPTPPRPAAAAPARAAMRMVSRFPPPAGPCPLRAAPATSTRASRSVGPGPGDGDLRTAPPAATPRRRRGPDDGRPRQRPASRGGRPATPAAGARGALRTPVWLGLLVGGMLAGCATGIGPAPRAAWPADAAAPAPVPVSMANELGRQALHERRFDEAAALFAQAADANPDLAEAWNGRAVALAALGRVAEAEAVIDAAFARGLDSEDLRANHDWLLRHRPTATVASAAVVEVASAAQADGAPVGPTATADAGAAIPADPATPPTAAAPDPAPATPPVDAPAAATPVEAVAADTAAPPAASDRLTGRAVRLEVSNGTGVDGLARRTAAALTARQQALSATRLTNHSHFAVAQTELHLREDADARLQRALVREVARTLGVSVAVVRGATLAPGVDARLVLGQDSRDARLAAAARRAPATGLAQRPSGGPSLGA